MPDLYRMALYWSEWPEFFEVDLDAPHCFRCDVVVVLDETKTRKELWREASRYLHRAHLADRYLGGLDGPQNLVPLCGRCHRSMPSFDDGDSAIRWCWAQWRYSDYETRPISPRILPDPEPDDEQAPPAPVGQGALF